jgi:hypothetical protein
MATTFSFGATQTIRVLSDGSAASFATPTRMRLAGVLWQPSAKGDAIRIKNKLTGATVYFKRIPSLTYAAVYPQPIDKLPDNIFMDGILVSTMASGSEAILYTE